ncbi:CRISPR-associated protein, Cse4 family (plasmid) [Mycobacterium sp. JS623]|uniref:type I-E CRISPR-associated protein Cas7/Cse4/CasC n=1 Tax=Mycobacterium sp. JS623 TaxID=212767 RepID=UPI0002A5B609|nr:type I-E CRISPR-associated protein Cas7/Cse4/CasC [Mycobacterium sp. JS623]AGB27116.1 CRISPR-associated protein, Cse4 family [Mycobacterium sp. JS623]
MFVDTHILQSVPPSNINRDDTGSPKTAIFGGAQRARVSSQAWKRATRSRFNATLDKSNIGCRTKRVVEKLSEQIHQLDGGLSTEDARRLASQTLTAAGITLTTPKPPKDAPKGFQPIELTSSLLFVSAGQYAKLAELAVAAHQASAKVARKVAKQAINSEHSFDVALFGRMVADDLNLNVDAAAQVAHAISVQAVEPEFDYFAAVDDMQERDQQAGAGMIGTIEFNSSTLYRYATVNVPGLRQNLGDSTAAARAVAAFVDSFILSMPTGKLSTFANRTVPEAILVSVRSDQPINLVGAFENPIQPRADGSVVAKAAAALADRHRAVADVYGPPVKTWVASLGDAAAPLEAVGDRVDMRTLTQQLEQSILEYLGAPA